MFFLTFGGLSFYSSLWPKYVLGPFLNFCLYLSVAKANGKFRIQFLRNQFFSLQILALWVEFWGFGKINTGIRRINVFVLVIYFFRYISLLSPFVGIQPYGLCVISKPLLDKESFYHQHPRHN